MQQQEQEEEQFQNGPHVLLQIASHLTKIHLQSESKLDEVAPITDDVQSILSTLEHSRQPSVISVKIEDISQRLCGMFDLPPETEFKQIFGCYLVKSNLIIKGHVLLSNSHLCFVAHVQKQSALIKKEGFLQKRKRATYYSQWVVLEDSFLSFYASSKDVYSPLRQVDLKSALGVQLLHKYKNGFKIVCPDKRYYLIADTQQAMEEWIQAIEASIFKARNDGEMLKVAIALCDIARVDFVYSSLLGDSIIVATQEQSDQLTSPPYKQSHKYTHSQSAQVSPSIQNHGEDYCFAYFRNCKEVFEALEVLRRDVQQTVKPQLPDVQQQISTVQKPTMFSNIAMRIHKQQLSIQELPMKWITSEETPTEASQIQKFFPGLYAEDSDLNIIFKVHAYNLGSFNYLPRIGQLFVTSQHVLFYSWVIGIKKRVIMPIGDIMILERVDNRLGFWYGLYVALRHGETWFEFHSFDARDRCMSILEELIESSKSVATTSGVIGDVTVEDQEIDDDDSSLDDEDAKPSSVLHSHHVRNLSLSKMLDDIHRLDSQFMASTQEVESEEIHNQRLALPVENIALLTQPSLAPLKIYCSTVGTRGDVQPFIALCKRLISHGHLCTIATHAEYQKWIESHGIGFRTISGNPSDLMQLCVDNGMFSISFFMEAASKFRVWFQELLESAWMAMKDADVIIESPVAMAGYHIAEKLQIPYFAAFPMPWTRTQEFSHPFAIADTPLGIGYNLMTWAMMENVLWKGMQNMINKFRRQTLSLPPLSSGSWLEDEHIPFLYSFSDEVVRPPRDWNTWITMCGYWFLDSPDSNWQPPDALAKFLQPSVNDSRPIVYIGFGSIIVKDPVQLTRTILQAVKKAGVRAIISKGWSARSVEADSHIKDNSDFQNDHDVYNLSSAPHDWLFPQVAAVVHHGGAGTTAAGLRAGKPTIIKPFFGDQFFWASRIQLLGVGLTLKKFDVDHLAELLIKITQDERIKTKALNLGEKIRAQDGVGVAVDTILRQIPILRKKIEIKHYTEVLESLNAVHRKSNVVTAAINTGLSVLSLKVGSGRKSESLDTSPQSPDRRVSAQDSLMLPGVHSSSPSQKLSQLQMRLKVPGTKSRRSAKNDPLASKTDMVDGYVSDTSVSYGRKVAVKPAKLRRKIRKLPQNTQSQHDISLDQTGWISWKSLNVLSRRTPVSKETVTESVSPVADAKEPLLQLKQQAAGKLSQVDFAHQQSPDHNNSIFTRIQHRIRGSSVSHNDTEVNQK